MLQSSVRHRLELSRATCTPTLTTGWGRTSVTFTASVVLSRPAGLGGDGGAGGDGADAESRGSQSMVENRCHE